MICPNGFKCIDGDGPDDAEVMCVGEAAGKVEEQRGIPLCGPTGVEFNKTYLPLAGLTRAQVYVTNTVKHCNTINKKPSEKDIATCTECKLKLELNRVSPKVLVLMGATACSILDNTKYEVDLDTQHGIPFRGELYGREYVIVPMWHPALGLHDTSKMTMLLDDWRILGDELSLILGCELQKDKVDPPRDYQLITTISELASYTVSAVHRNSPPWALCGIDTESHGKRPYSIQLSLRPHTARMLMLEDQGLVGFCVDWVNHAIRAGMVLVVHNAPADLPLLDSLGIKGYTFRDTMAEAYILARYPQALKALSYRLLGRKRKSWEETVREPSLVKLSEWIIESILFAQTHWTQVEQRYGKKGQLLKPKVHKSKAESVLTRIMQHMWNKTYNPWERIQEDLLPLLGDEVSRYAALAPVPVKGIAHCELKDQIEYACSDADDTLSLALLFDELMVKGIPDIYEGDVDGNL